MEKLKRFSKINVEIGNVCNLQCSFCPEVIRAKKFMTPDFFERILPQLAPLTDQVCFHLMGDPLVHPELEKFVESCARHRVPIFFVTNGVLLREPQQELLLHPIFRQVNFSLHSFFDNHPDRDPGPYLERIFSYSERALHERPELYLNYRLWNLHSERGGSLRNREMLGQIEQRFQVPLPLDKIDVRGRRSLKIKGRLSLHFDSEFTWPAPELPLLGSRGTCQGLRNHFGILADGTVVPCCLDKEGVISLGSLHTQSIEEILNSPRASAMRLGFENRHLTEELCRRCPYISRFGRS